MAGGRPLYCWGCPLSLSLFVMTSRKNREKRTCWPTISSLTDPPGTTTRSPRFLRSCLSLRSNSTSKPPDLKLPKLTFGSNLSTKMMPSTQRTSSRVSNKDFPPTSMLGDLWHLDAHRLRCGNSLEEGAFASLLNNEKATAAIIDPPYNVRIHGHASGKGRTTHREFPMAVGEMNPKEFVDFLNRSLTSLRAHCAPGSLIYACRRPTSSSDTSKGFKIPYAIDAPIHQMFYLSAIRGRSATCEKSRDPFWSTDGSEVRAVNRHALGLSTPQA